MGGSGSGKTVLLRIIDGLIHPDSGAVRLFGRHIEHLSEEAVLPVRRRLGYVFQSAALFDSLTVEENVAFPLQEHTDLAAAEIHRRVVHFLSLVGLDEKVLPLLPNELSGGMRKRVGIARALIGQPDVLLFDEPTAGLDPTNSKVVGELISELGSEVCDTAIVVTHDLELAKTVADRVAVLIEGRFATVGRLDDVLGSRDPAVQAFLSGEAR
jgi:phospholipid/cholesterol/gamma-HCH transport system ATP-binding protein